MADTVYQRCINPDCSATFAVEQTNFLCSRCGSLLDVAYDWNRFAPPKSLRDFEAKWADRADPLNLSGVWRFRELMPFAPSDKIMTIGEGQTILQKADAVAKYVGLEAGKLFLQYEGLNPSGSFKDNGMTAAFTHARLAGARRAACASTGNTSASLAVFCSATGLMRAVIFIGSGKISYGKLAQALDHGALTVQIAGDFDDAMERVQNLGNVSAFGKAFMELEELGLLKRLPRLAVINAAGANTFYQLYEKQGLRWHGGRPDRQLADRYFDRLDAEKLRASTIASAIEINRPVNLPKALRAMDRCGGVVREATDQEILDAKAKVGAGGLGCEPASAASVAGARKLRQEGVIAPSDRVVCILTGHQLKDPNATVAYHSTDQKTFDDVLGQRGVRRATYANRAVQVPNDLDEIIKTIELYS